MDKTLSRPPSELGHRLLQAGAGAGKTTTLIATFLQFVRHHRQSHGEFPRVIITTFTRKATQEVKERLMRKALESSEEEIFRYLGQRSRVHISTIHGVLSIFLARYGDRIGLPADFRLIDQDDLRLLGRRELRRILADPENPATALLEEHTFSELWSTLEQWRQFEGSVTNAKPIATGTFRQQARDHVKNFIAQARSLAAEIPNASKNARWHEWSGILSRFVDPGESDAHLEIFLDQVAAVEESSDKPRVAAGKNRLVDEAVGERFKAFVADSWKPLVDNGCERFRPSFWRRHEERCQIFNQLAETYKFKLDTLLLRLGGVSMADLERRSLEIIRLDPSAAASFAKEWDYWMIDEYQDTSPLQVELLQALVGDRPHFVVGDPQQSIYFFRGARSEVFFAKKQEFEMQKAHVERVGANYRSRAPVLGFLNAFFAPLNGFSSMEPKSSKESAEHIPAAEFRVVEPSEEHDQAVLAVIERIQELIEGGAQPESICVLSRKNSDLKAVVEEARKRNIPTQLQTAGGFTGRREVLDAAAFLRFILNPADNMNFVGLLRSPWFFLADEEILKFTRSRPTSFWTAALQVFADQPESHPIKRLSRWLELSSEVGLATALRGFYRNEGILDSAQRADPSGRREANLWKFLVQLELAQKKPGFNGLAFARDFDQGASTEEGNEDGDASPAVEPKRVNLMTVHSSKGLEFEHVIVTHLHSPRMAERTELFMGDEESGLWTLAEKNLAGQKTGSLLSVELLERKKQRLSEESARVLYVAMTRAMGTITLVWENKSTARGDRSWAAMVPFAMEPGLHQRDGFQYRVRTEIPNPKMGFAQPLADSELKKPWQSSGKETRQVVSATELLEKAELTSKQSSVSLAPGPEAATRGLRIAQRGTDAHRLFEALKYASADEVKAMAGDPSLAKAVSWVTELNNPPLLNLIRNGFAEWGFAAQGNSFVLQGQIDLWAIDKNEVWLVDYKTGSMEYVQKALDQLKIYAWALHHMKEIQGDQRIHLLAVYPMDQEVKLQSFAKVSELSTDWRRLLPS